MRGAALSAILSALVCVVAFGAPARAEQAGGRISADQPDVGRVEARIQKYDQALGVTIQLVRPLGAQTECNGVCYLPSSTRPISWRCAPKQRCDLHCAVTPPVGGCD
jgi:hypothetical protein